ncbi:MAG: ribonuclease Y [Tenericutes bacterium]|jgi:ribonuclease Y|nr:ribonuclease Y [Bacilli bacterium]NLV89974.1 ribonuclease Y [Mycoplasmatota bacterium]
MGLLGTAILASIFGLGIGATTVFVYNNRKGNSATKKADEIIEKAKKESEKVKRDSVLEAKEEIHKLKMDNEKEIKDRKTEIKDLEDRLFQREAKIDKRDELLQNRDKSLEERDNALSQKQREIQKKEDEVEQIKKEQEKLLENISGFSKDKAHDLLLKRVEESMELEIAQVIKEKEAEAKLEVDKKAKDLLVLSMQKYSSDVVNEQTVSVVNLPNDEMKGRIIGREGRNIRTIEAVTGVDLIIDDTPEAIVISSFDPLRREIAKITLESLIKDGRIHPARIEELYDKVCKDMNSKIMEYGNNAVLELGLSKIDPFIVEIIGKLHFRTSYGQNALQHSMEVASLAGIMASEIGENVMLAKRAGLLHDIGKAIDFEMEGSHVEVGIEIAKKYNEDKVVINSIESHHGDTEAKSIISVLIAIADALSASRPGARNDSLENYIKRLEQLETIANSFEGIEKSFAMQAGRELRVIVKPEQVDDLKSYKIARDIKDRIEEEMQYPGTVKVTVIRETRAIEEAK